MVVLFTWDDIYTNALETSFGMRELTAKDNAREELKYLIEKEAGIDIDETQIPEETIDGWLDEQEQVPYFDYDGHLIARFIPYNGLDKSVEQVTNAVAEQFPNTDLEPVFKELELPYDKS